MRHTGSLIVLALLLCGCNTTQNNGEDDKDSQPATRKEPLEWGELRPAVKALLKAIAAKEDNWPDWVVKTSNKTPKLRLGEIGNRTTLRFDQVELKNRLLNALVEQGAVSLESDKKDDDDDLGDINAERDYGDDDDDDHDDGGGQANLILEGELTGKPGEYSFDFRITDPAKGRILVATRTPVGS